MPDQSPEGPPLIFAHRGLNRVAPENTLPAFERAAAAGVTWLETDVTLLADGTPVLLHNPTVDETTDGTGPARNLTLGQVQQLDAGAWFSPNFVGTPLPTLRQLVDFLNESGMNANIELKVAEDDPATTPRVLAEATLRELGRLDPRRELIISSFSVPALQAARQANPDLTLALLLDEGEAAGPWHQDAADLRAKYIHANNSGLTRGEVRAFTAAGYGVSVYTVNDPQRARELLDWGVTGIFTDTADQFLDLMDP